jgi:hypothetical protein
MANPAILFAVFSLVSETGVIVHSGSRIFVGLGNRLDCSSIGSHTFLLLPGAAFLLLSGASFLL